VRKSSSFWKTGSLQAWPAAARPSADSIKACIAAMKALMETADGRAAAGHA